MKSFFVIFIVLGVLIPLAYCPTAATFGVAKSVSANTQYQFSYSSGLVTLDIMVNENTQITVFPYINSNLAASLVADGAAPIPNDFQVLIYNDISFGAIVGFKLTFSSPASIVNTATLVIPVDNSQVNLNYNPAILQWDSTVMAYTFVGIVTTQLYAQFTFSDPGIFLTVQYNPATPVTFPSIFSQVLTISNKPTSYSFPNGVFIGVSSSTSGLVFNVVYITFNPEPIILHYTSVGKFIDITLNTIANVNANISFAYTSNYDQTKLAIAYFDISSNLWTFPSTGLSVNTQTQIVSQTTNHFSTWGLYYASHSSTTKVTVAWATIIFVCALLLS